MSMNNIYEKATATPIANAKEQAGKSVEGITIHTPREDTPKPGASENIKKRNRESAPTKAYNSKPTGPVNNKSKDTVKKARKKMIKHMEKPLINSNY